MKVMPISDLHYEFYSGYPAFFDQLLANLRICSRDADLVVLSGDVATKGNGLALAAGMFPEKPIVLVAGNHEFYGAAFPRELETLREEAAKYPDIYFLEDDSIEIDDCVILGATLWTDFQLYGAERSTYCEALAQIRMVDYQLIRSSARGFKPLQASETMAKHRQSVLWIREQLSALQGRKVIIVTHHAPSPRSIAPLYQGDSLSAAFASDLEDLITQYQPDLWLHGHTHCQSDYYIGHTRVISNCVGYPGEVKKSGFNINFLVNI